MPVPALGLRALRGEDDLGGRRPSVAVSRAFPGPARPPLPPLGSKASPRRRLGSADAGVRHGGDHSRPCRHGRSR